MVNPTQTLGWSVWTIVLIVIALIVAAGLLYLAY